MGEGGAERPISESQYSEIEMRIAAEEAKLGLKDIEFETYERCIKRFGYRKDISERCWEASYDELKIKLPKPPQMP